MEVSRSSGILPSFSTHQPVSSHHSLNSHTPIWKPENSSTPIGTATTTSTRTPITSNPHADRHQSTSSVRTLQVRARQIQVARAEEISGEEIDYTVLDPPIVAGAYVQDNARAASRLDSELGGEVANGDDEDGNHYTRRPRTWNTNTLLDGSPDATDDSASEFDEPLPPPPAAGGRPHNSRNPSSEETMSLPRQGRTMGRAV